ncbi:DUF1840 domain-containing protein [Hydrogenophaga sp. T2]|uniref:DUF1840 domain-containing protein n=1 Tax=Hydrogenophaga sp. T2 TaxID=3132823 RepID=UPI003CE83820
MTVYRFKSRETGDLVMLRPHGQRLLEIIGKDPHSPGVLQPEEIPRAIERLRAAVAAEEAEQKPAADEADGDDDKAAERAAVSLRMRSAPFIEMLERCLKAGVEVVWGV